jgi:hypothetical protein
MSILRVYAYFAYQRLLTRLPGTLSRAVEPLVEESQVTASRQHNLKISSHLLKLARVNRGEEP